MLNLVFTTQPCLSQWLIIICKNTKHKELEAKLWRDCFTRDWWVVACRPRSVLISWSVKSGPKMKQLSLCMWWFGQWIRHNRLLCHSHLVQTDQQCLQTTCTDWMDLVPNCCVSLSDATGEYKTMFPSEQCHVIYLIKEPTAFNKTSKKVLHSLVLLFVWQTANRKVSE